jgi:hypothetical protein
LGAVTTVAEYCALHSLLLFHQGTARSPARSIIVWTLKSMAAKSLTVTFIQLFEGGHQGWQALGVLK